MSGGAFQKIVSSLVEDLIMPTIGVLIGGVVFSDLKIVLVNSFQNDKGVIVPEVAFRYGNFIQVLFNFLIIAFSLFLFIKVYNRLNSVKVLEHINVENTFIKKLFSGQNKNVDKDLDNSNSQQNKIADKKSSDDETLEVLKEIRNLLKKNKK